MFLLYNFSCHRGVTEFVEYKLACPEPGTSLSTVTIKQSLLKKHRDLMACYKAITPSPNLSAANELLYACRAVLMEEAH
jgi:hypothetical protein